MKTRSFFLILIGRFRASCISSLFLIIVASSLRSNASKSMYDCESGTSSRTFCGIILSFSFDFFLLKIKIRFLNLTGYFNWQTFVYFVVAAAVVELIVE